MLSNNQKKKRYTTPPEEMREKRRRYVEFVVVHGMNKRRAAFAAGFTRSTALCASGAVETPEVREEIARRTKSFVETVPIDAFVERYMAGLDATMVESAGSAVPDYRTRLEYAIEIALMGVRHGRK